MTDTTFGPPAGANADTFDRWESGECAPCIGGDHAECHGYHAGTGSKILGIPPLAEPWASEARLEGCACRDDGCIAERGRLREATR